MNESLEVKKVAKASIRCLVAELLVAQRHNQEVEIRRNTRERIMGEIETIDCETYKAHQAIAFSSKQLKDLASRRDKLVNCAEVVDGLPELKNTDAIITAIDQCGAK